MRQAVSANIKACSCTREAVLANQGVISGLSFISFLFHSFEIVAIVIMYNS